MGIAALKAIPSATRYYVHVYPVKHGHVAQGIHASPAGAGMNRFDAPAEVDISLAKLAASPARAA
jgi:hypothetical protein